MRRRRTGNRRRSFNSPTRARAMAKPASGCRFHGEKRV